MSIPVITPIWKFIVAKKWWLVLLVVLGLIGLGWYHRVQANKPKLTFAHPTYSDLTQTLEASGTVNAKEKAVLRFIAGGKVVYLGAKEGQTVKRWQTIATIDARDLKKRLEKSLNLYSQERNSWDQTLDDTKDRALPQSEIRDVNTNQLTLNNTVIDVELADIAISNTAMTTPIAGVLVSSPTNVSGVTLAATDTFTVVNPSSLVFQAEVDESDIAKVHVGQKVTLRLDAYPDQPVETTVGSISYTATQTSSGTVFLVDMPITSLPAGLETAMNNNAMDSSSSARAASKSANTKTTNNSSTTTSSVAGILGTYRLGMNGDASVSLASRTNVLTVPLYTTRERDGKFYVDVKTGPDTYQEREIQVGLQTDDDVEVTGGLSKNDEILLPS